MKKKLYGFLLVDSKKDMDCSRDSQIYTNLQNQMAIKESNKFIEEMSYYLFLY